MDEPRNVNMVGRWMFGHGLRWEEFEFRRIKLERVRESLKRRSNIPLPARMQVNTNTGEFDEIKLKKSLSPDSECPGQIERGCRTGTVGFDLVRRATMEEYFGGRQMRMHASGSELDLGRSEIMKPGEGENSRREARPVKYCGDCKLLDAWNHRARERAGKIESTSIPMHGPHRMPNGERSAQAAAPGARAVATGTAGDAKEEEETTAQKEKSPETRSSDFGSGSQNRNRNHIRETDPESENREEPEGLVTEFELTGGGERGDQEEGGVNLDL
ncbi:hypothetical protein C8R44DRAFT_731998 [Mycena epipterygia]|nr:hypothetical protein C8R44DRAFT_731998 [Mycena epipterygia]